MKQKLLLSMLLSILGMALFSSEAAAIPAFARKYKTACMTCHAPFPRLTAVGEAFRLNGYNLPGSDELYVKDEPVTMGAELYKQVFPNSVWPSSIPHLPPISLRLTGDLTGDTGRFRKDSHVNFDFQDEVNILAAGTFTDRISFFMAISIDNAGGVGPEGWLEYRGLFDCLLGMNHLNIRAGNLGEHEIGLPNTRDTMRLSAEDYLYATALGLDIHPGFEINGFGKNWRYAVGVLEADDSNDEKDPYAVLAFKLFGLGFDGSGGTKEEGGITTTPAGYWRDDSILLGFFGFRSHDGPGGKINDRFGVDLRGNYKDFSIAGGFIRGEDHLNRIDQNIGFGELEYWVFPWWVAYTRYEDLVVTNVDEQDVQRFIVGSSFLVVANLKINIEGRFHLTNEPAIHINDETINDDRLTLRIDWAF